MNLRSTLDIIGFHGPLTLDGNIPPTDFFGRDQSERRRRPIDGIQS